MNPDVRTKKRILLIEPSQIVSNGFSTLIEDVIGYQIVGVISDVNHLQDKMVSCCPDIIVFNPLLLTLRHQTSIRSFFLIPCGVAFVAFAYTFVDEWIMVQFDAVLSINDGLTQIANKLNEIKLPAHVQEKSDSEELSDRENEILVSIVQGMTNQEIANRHFISIHTVITHRKNIIRKTGIKSVSGLTVYALLNNLITYEDIN